MEDKEFYKSMFFLDEEYLKIPKLFDLDNYDECLSKPDGMYCLATFNLVPEKEFHPTYQLIQEYSKDVYAFNRTLIHRGYCVSERCPQTSNVSWAGNLTRRLEQCANKATDHNDLRAELHTLDYCQTTDASSFADYPDLPQVIYLAIVAAIVLINIIGTVYDVMADNNPKKIHVLICWSMRSSWKTLTQTYNNSTHMPLAALQGIRVAVAISICFVHSGVIYYTLYHYNPRVLEQVTGNPLTMLVQNSTAVEQMFVVLSSFFCVYSLKRTSKEIKFSFGFLIKLLAKRIFRIGPLYFLVIGFMATWWPHINSGPLWPAIAVTESNVCREKFLSHALFVHNLYEPEKYCVLPSWALAVDVQMYLVAGTVTMLLASLPRGRILVLLLLLAASIVMNAVLANVFQWKPLVYFFTVTEDVRSLFRDIPSFKQLYMSPWGNLPACFVGLIIGHLYPTMMATNFNYDKYKWILNVAYILSIPVLATWLLMGNVIQHIRNNTFVAVYAAAERSLFQILCLLIYVLLSVLNSFIIRLFAWRGWQPIAQLSLSVMLLHWGVNMMLVLPAPQPIPTSATNLLTLGAATTCFTFLLALPLTLLVEIPMMKFYDALITFF